MPLVLSHQVVQALQRVFWIYLTNNGFISGMKDFEAVEPPPNSRLIPITLANYTRVQEFREQSRVREYRNKLAGKEIGFFAECDNSAVGSIWATVNHSDAVVEVRNYIRLRPHEALMHDAVTAQNLRAKGVGTFMVSAMASILLTEHNVRRIILDVNVRNKPSLRMLAKAGISIRETTLAVSAFGKLIFTAVLRHYPTPDGVAHNSPA
jgi:RimJ/RimL family protein N-acetyltransferase